MASNKINYNDRGKCQINLLLVSVSNLFPISSRILILFLQKRKKKSILGDYCFSYRDNGFIMLYPIFTILSWTVCQLLHSKIQSVMNYRYFTTRYKHFAGHISRMVWHLLYKIFLVPSPQYIQQDKILWLVGREMPR